MFGYKKNMSMLDRVLRIIMASAVIFAAFYWSDSSFIKIGAVIIGAYYIFVALAGKSPFYKLIGAHSDERIH